MRVPFHRPEIGVEEIDAATRVLRSGWLTTGPVAAQFEAAICDAVHAKHAIAVNSCTAGLFCALATHLLGCGDEVITSPLTYCGTIQAIEQSGATPVLADIGADLNLDPDSVERAITAKTRAILPVHYAGLPASPDRFNELQSRHNLEAVEDAAHAFGAGWRGIPIGSSDRAATVFSFYANKNITSGEGGVITTANREYADRVRRFVHHGVRRADSKAHAGWRYEVIERGFKANLSDVLAAIGLEQIRKSLSFSARRRAIAARYNRALNACDLVELPPVHPDSTHAWHLYVLRLHTDRLSIDRDAFVSALEQSGVGCSVHFRPIPLHPAFHYLGGLERLPVTARESARVVSLPIFPAMTDAEVAFVIDRVLNTLERCKR